MKDRAIFIAGAGAVLVLGVVGYLAARKLGQTITANADLVNPLSRDNVVARGVNAVGAAISGNPNYNLGASIFEATHSEPDLTAGVDVAPALSIAELLTRSYYIPWAAGQERALAEHNRQVTPPDANGEVWIVG